ncbi:MAG: HD domain-containing protein [Candidatus Pacearchaeota archaeon]|nr:HD domain-containing protein [Candidatus Pacearchaeota archaeon]
MRTQWDSYNPNQNRALGLMREYDRLEPYIMNKLERLPKSLKYHNAEHTKDVINSSGKIALVEGIKMWDVRYWLVKIGALLHDTGYILQPSGKDHEELGADFARRLLGNFGYEHYDIINILRMIRATKLPQNPRTILEGIVCDADLDNLGRADFFKRGKLLREELESLGIKNSDKEWYQRNLKFLENHGYHTKAARYLRNGKKKENVEQLKGIIASLE